MLTLANIPDIVAETPFLKGFDMAEKAIVKRRVGLKSRLDEIDERIVEAVSDGYYQSRLAIILGEWEKGKVIKKEWEFRRVNSQKCNYFILEKETDKNHKSLKKWHLLYLANPNKQEYEVLAAKKAHLWTNKYFEALKAKLKKTKELQELPEGVFLYNVWQLEPRRIEGYGLGDFHGVTPVEVCLHTLRAYCPPNGKVYDSMSGSDTFLEVAEKLGIECDASDLLTGTDAAQTGKPNNHYDLVFNHFAYWNMVHYSNNPQDLSNLATIDSFFEKCNAIFVENYRIIKPKGYYCVMIGDLRKQRQTKWLTTEFIDMGVKAGFECYDNAYISTVNTEHVSTGLAEYRAKKFGYMKASVDWYLVFKKPR